MARTDIPILVDGRMESDVYREMQEWWLRNADDHDIVSFDQFVIELAVRGFDLMPGRNTHNSHILGRTQQ